MFAAMMMFSELTQPTTTPGAAAPCHLSADQEDAFLGNQWGSKMDGWNKKKDYDAEYKQLERAELEDMLSGELPSFSSGQARCNERKNRYSNNLPLESTRVRLASRPHTPGSDYINANYVRAPTTTTSDRGGDAEYIAAQAPLSATCGDFWRMVAERGAGLVVMLTRLREGERTKASRYWPRRVGQTVRFGEVRVRLVSAHSHYGPTRDDLVVRRFLIRRTRVAVRAATDQLQQDDCDALASDASRELEGEESGDGEWQEVVHLHYQAWPDFGRPELSSFKELLRLVDVFRVATPHAPVVTHCSAGLGRAGVLIAAHMGLVQLRRSGVHPDVWGLVRHIRKQRPGMVQTLEQYAFIHEIIDTLLAERIATLDIATSRIRAPQRCASSPAKISAKPCCSTQGSGTSSPSPSSCCSAPSFDYDLMDYDTSSATTTTAGQQQGRQMHRGRQSLCSSTPAIYMRA